MATTLPHQPASGAPGSDVGSPGVRSASAFRGVVAEPPGDPLHVDHYCMECFAPSADEFCLDHAYLGVRLCEFCERPAIVNDAGLLHCLRRECIRKAAER